MRDFRIGSVLGIEVRIHISWFVVFFLLVWALSASLFPAAYPQLTQQTHFFMGVAGTLLFFASLLGHELAHSIVARARGIAVEGITLFIFGGVARTAREARHPGDEFLIAVVGPLASVAIGIVFGLIWWFGTWLGLSVAITGVAAYLGLLNMLLAVFNMLPGFPMDGGRILRAFLWRLSGNVRKATHVAAGAGKIVGYGLIAIGVWRLFSAEIVGGIWMVFIGIFLRQTAATSYQQHVMRSALDHVPARIAMTPDPACVPPTITIQKLIDDYMLRHSFSAFPVTEEGRALGWVSLREARSVPQEDWPAHTVRDLMIPLGRTLTVRPDDPMSHVLERIRGSTNHRLVVEQDNQLVGIITATDVTRWLDRLA